MSTGRFPDGGWLLFGVLRTNGKVRVGFGRRWVDIPRRRSK